jgi:biopolymer transport protein ExbD
MRFRARAADEPSLQLVGMVDVVFLLVIFWMMVTALGGPKLDARIRPPASGLARGGEPAALTVQVGAADGPVLVDGEPVARGGIVPAVEALPPGPILLRADGAAPAGRVASVLAELQTTGRAVDLAVRRVEGEP